MYNGEFVVYDCIAFEMSFFPCASLAAEMAYFNKSGTNVVQMKQNKQAHKTNNQTNEKKCNEQINIFLPHEFVVI